MVVYAIQYNESTKRVHDFTLTFCAAQGCVWRLATSKQTSLPRFAKVKRVPSSGAATSKSGCRWTPCNVGSSGPAPMRCAEIPRRYEHVIQDIAANPAKIKARSRPVLRNIREGGQEAPPPGSIFSCKLAADLISTRRQRVT